MEREVPEEREERYCIMLSANGSLQKKGRRECLVTRDSLNGGPPKAAEYLKVGHVFSCQTTATSPGLARLNATRGQPGHIETAPLRVFAQTITAS